MLAACGGGAQGNGGGSLAVSTGAKKTLEKMETAAFAGAAGFNCRPQASPYANDVKELLDTAAPVLSARIDVRPPATSIDLLTTPPRPEDGIGVFLCAGAESRTFTIFRTVFVSADFVHRLKENTANAGGDALFRSALAFVLYHEIGHAALNHSAAKLDPGPSFSLPQELEADQFAYDTMAAAGIGFAGVDVAKFTGADLVAAGN